jgi:phage terminase large subunit-like protein
MARGIVYWHPERLDKLREMILQNKPITEIARYFGKKPEAIRMIISLHKLKSQKSTRGITSIEHKRKQISQKDIAKRLQMLQNLEVKPEAIEQQFKDEQLLAWVRNYPLFIKEVCNVKLQPYQKKMIELMKSRKRVCFVMGRASGKTFTVALFSIAESIINPNRKIIIIAPTLRQSKILFDTITGFIASSDALYNSVTKTTSGMEFLIRFSNNSEIIALPCGDRGETIRGFRATHLIVEEAAYVPDEVFNAVIPFLATTDGNLILLGTPSGKQGKFWEAFNSPEYAKLHLPSSINKYLPKDWFLRAKNELSSISYETEILANFSQSIGSFFRLETIEKCTQKYDLTSFPESNKTYYCGIDWGRFHDKSAIIIVSKDSDNQVKVENIIEIENEALTLQTERIKKLHEVYNFRKIVAEYSGLGIMPCDKLSDEGLPIEKFHPTLANKEDVFNHLLKQMESGLVIIPNYQRLQFQLRNFKFELTAQGKMKLHHVTEEVGDDLVDALCFAVWATKESGGVAVLDPMRLDPTNIIGLW